MEHRSHVQVNVGASVIDAKRCARCERTLQLSEFYCDKNRRDGLYPACKSCHYKRTRAWAEANPKRHKELGRIRYANGGAEKHRAKKRLAKYGLTPAQFNALMDAQGGVCAICLLPFVDSVGTGKGHGAGAGNWDLASVDHCHETGRVRGILHRRCNLALELGLTEEDWRRARDYLAADKEAVNGAAKQ